MKKNIILIKTDVESLTLEIILVFPLPEKKPKIAAFIQAKQLLGCKL